MRLHPHPLALSLLGASVALLSACGSLSSGGGTRPADAAAAAPRTVATPQSDGRTAEGGFIDGFFFSERPGDVTFNPVVLAGGTARVTGVIEPRHGSTWGGIAITTAFARNNRTIEVSTQRALLLTLSAANPSVLRVRLVGPNAAVRDSGCYPVTNVRVTPEPREYALPIAAFAPETYCPAGSPDGPAAAASLLAVEVADALVQPGRRRAVDFSVGTIRVTP